MGEGGLSGEQLSGEQLSGELEPPHQLMAVGESPAGQGTAKVMVGDGSVSSSYKAVANSVMNVQIYIQLRVWELRAWHLQGVQVDRSVAARVAMHPRSSQRAVTMLSGEDLLSQQVEHRHQSLPLQTSHWARQAPSPTWAPSRNVPSNRHQSKREEGDG